MTLGEIVVAAGAVEFLALLLVLAAMAPRGKGAARLDLEPRARPARPSERHAA